MVQASPSHVPPPPQSDSSHTYDPSSHITSAPGPSHTPHSSSTAAPSQTPKQSYTPLGQSLISSYGNVSIDDHSIGLTGLSASTTLGTATTTQLTNGSLVGLGLTATTTLGNVAPLGFKAITGTQSASYSTVTGTQTGGYSTVTGTQAAGYTRVTRV